MKLRTGLFEPLVSLGRLLLGRPKIPASLAENELLRAILYRRSVRAFTDRPIPEDVFDAILEAARLAPSTVNLQTWSFAVFDQASWRQTFDRPLPFRGDRAVIVIADTYRARQVLDVFPTCPLIENTVAVMNASLAAMNMNIAAEALGVSSVMLSETGQTGLLDAEYLKEKLVLPPHTLPILTIVFGYASGAYPPMPPRLPTEQLFFTGRYCEPDRATMESWLSQMKAGYKASHLNSSFDHQVEIYRRKITGAEEYLGKEVFVQKNLDP